ncbi:MAG: transporter, ATP-binding/permease protein [Modestobacter sp.]|jgi:ATP-binding cassette subfamily B protein|nr:transporter, ATP-binding/permease protein [Modestobacter sp.]
MLLRGRRPPRPAEPAPDGQLQDQLVDRAWESHDAELSGARFTGMARRLPGLIGQVARLSWAASRVDTAATVGLDVVAGVLTAFGLLSTAHVLQALFADGPTPERLRSALPALLVVGTIAAVRMALVLTAGWMTTRLKPQVDRVVERRLFEATTQVELAAFDTPGFYDGLQRARDRGLSEAPRVVQTAISVLVSLVGVIAAASVLGLLQPLLLPLLLIAALPEGWVAVRMARMRYRTSYELAVCRRRKWILADLMADRRSAAEVRSFTMRGFLLAAYDRLASRERGIQLDLARRQMVMTSAGDIVGSLGLGLVYVALGLLLNERLLPLSVAGTAVIAIRAGQSSLYGTLYSLNQCYESGLYYSDYVAFCEEAEQATRHRQGGRPGPEWFSTIAVSDVSFSYPGGHTPALRGVSMEIHRGQVVALVGENGSGKSTLAKILAGLYQPSEGSVRWDDVSLNEVDSDDLRERIAVIMQDFTRWPMTARDNITMGRPDDEDRVATAASAAGAEEVIRDLPAGYDTHLDRRFRGGAELSGGQWQRVAIARGFYRDAALLICDEPTASLDARSEHALFETIRSHAEGRTVLLITHRLASVRAADRIYVLDHGQVVQEGTHDQLLGAGGLYSELYTLQASAYGAPASPEGRAGVSDVPPGAGSA